MNYSAFVLCIHICIYILIAMITPYVIIERVETHHSDMLEAGYKHEETQKITFITSNLGNFPAGYDLACVGKPRVVQCHIGERISGGKRMDTLHRRNSRCVYAYDRL